MARVPAPTPQATSSQRSPTMNDRAVIETQIAARLLDQSRTGLAAAAGLTIPLERRVGQVRTVVVTIDRRAAAREGAPTSRHGPDRGTPHR
jgi:hypothetical protein